MEQARQDGTEEAADEDKTETKMKLNYRASPEMGQSRQSRRNMSGRT